MQRGGHMPKRPPAIQLPPEEFRLYDPKREGLLETPLDERGLVAVGSLIQMVKQTVDPEFDWHSEFADVHHLQWPASRYRLSEDVLSNDFRDLAISKARIPRVFHNWTHRITVPPPMPDHDVMRYRIEAQTIALDLFRTARQTTQLMRIAELKGRALERRLVQNVEEYSYHFNKAVRMPTEFQLINPEEVRAETPEEVVSAGAKLGRFATVTALTHKIYSASQAA